MKRKLTKDEPRTPTRKRTRASAPDEEEENGVIPAVETPSRRTRGQHSLSEDIRHEKVNGVKDSVLNGVNEHGTPKSLRKVLFSTPTKPRDEESANGTPTIVRNADRSARRKSTRRLIERTINGDESDEGEDEEALVEQILGEEGEDEEERDGLEDIDQEGEPAPETPSKRGRGRPKTKPRKQHSPTPPQNLPAHEEYFWQNRPGGTKTSNNIMSSRILLAYDEYRDAIKAYKDPHAAEEEFLLELHSRSFDQWIFELQEGFNICLYGYGSKRPLTKMFAAHLYEHLSNKPPYSTSKQKPKIVIINGFWRGIRSFITIKDILTTVASSVFPPNTKFSSQPATLLTSILTYLNENPPPRPLPIILNSIDFPALRRSPIPSILAQLSAHSSINLICTADTPNFPLLWDLGQRAQFRFLFHDATTFAPYDAEIDVVDSVNQLLGRSGMKLSGRDGVSHVLRSLPVNARLVFRILVTEQLALFAIDGTADSGADEGEEPDFATTATPRHETNPASRKGESTAAIGVDYYGAYRKAVEELACTSEVGFRQLLKEFFDHQMIESRKDVAGKERLLVPFRREELEEMKNELTNEEDF
ncbi:ORC2-domain-containing protein [Lepidopterella palustris CBS 459.81]|uniref:Origin recognition complex subunit 2 n=1 Tax=Lepidopterella palustris CBS 459.81 TaxID=1314670 RepID=A0A8E2ECZ3_9PEZI|nr:ORC2-domain-containing protein [Lepidopterella palustris CBS 459.81]